MGRHTRHESMHEGRIVLFATTRVWDIERTTRIKSHALDAGGSRWHVLCAVAMSMRQCHPGDPRPVPRRCSHPGGACRRRQSCTHRHTGKRFGADRSASGLRACARLRARAQVRACILHTIYCFHISNRLRRQPATYALPCIRDCT